MEGKLSQYMSEHHNFDVNWSMQQIVKRAEKWSSQRLSFQLDVVR